MASTFCRDNTGRAAKLYRNTGTPASPIWSEVVEAKDLKINMSLEEIDDSDRSTIWKLVEAGTVEISISGQLSNRKDSVNVEAMRDLVFSRCAEQFALMDGPIATVGTEGILAGCKVLAFDMDFALGNTKMIDFELKPSYYEDPGVAGTQIVPTWHVVT